MTINTIVCTTFCSDYLIPYMQEWVDYYYKLGFSKIYIYTTTNLKLEKQYENVFIKEFKYNNLNSYEQNQTDAYNECYNENLDYADFCCFFDTDEFLNTKGKKIDIFLKDYIDIPCIFVRWRLFGSNGHNKKTTNLSVITRFTKCSPWLEFAGKCIFNVKCINKILKQQTPNIVACCAHGIFKNINVYEVTKTPQNTKEYNEHIMNQALNIGYINHYITKSREELREKILNNMNKSTWYISEVNNIGIEKIIDNFDISYNSSTLDMSLYNFFNSIEQNQQ